MGICCAVLLALGVFVLSPGLSHFRTTIRDLQGAPTCFRGVRSFYNDTTKVVKLLAVHGMGEHKAGYSLSLSDGLAGQMGFKQVGSYQDLPLDLEVLGADKPHANLRRLTYAAGDRRLEIFEVTWSPLVQEFKQDLLLAFEKQHASERALLNRDVKYSLVDDSLSDVAIYLGASGAYIRNAVKETVCRMVNGTLKGDLGQEACTAPHLEPDAAITMVTFSLGSKITFDSVNQLDDSEPGSQAVQQLLGSTASIFMLANQLPLLALVADSPGEKLAAAPGAPASAPTSAPAPQPGASSLTRMLQLRHRQGLVRERVVPQALEVVTISDPNDLLSYPLPPYFAEQNPQDKLVNVTTRFAWRFLSGMAANPIQAHTGHLQSKKVMKMLADGAS